LTTPKRKQNSKSDKAILVAWPELRYGVIAGLEKQLKEASLKLKRSAEAPENAEGKKFDAEDIADIVAKWTGIPVPAHVRKRSDETSFILEDRIHERLIDQEDAVKAVADAIRRSRAGLQDGTENRLARLSSLGSTGVGENRISESLAEFLFNDENAVVRIDMTEYMEKFSVSRAELARHPPGYVGYEEGGPS